MADTVAIQVGRDRFVAQLMAERCRADGISVELLLMDENGNAPGLGLTQHRLLVRRVDVDQVRALLPEWVA
jgi:hypothetical protein